MPASSALTDWTRFRACCSTTPRSAAAHPATREKDLGIWQTWTWAQVADEVRALACGLAAQGFKRGMNLAIIGDNRPRLYWTMAAVQALGGVPVPLYQDAVAEEMVYVLNDADMHFAVVEDQEQVDKLLEIRDRCRNLAHIIFDDPRGLRHYTQDFLHGFDGIQGMGRAHHEAHPDFFADEVAEGGAEDVAVMVYTSGTTGKPKGVCLTHAALIAAARGGVEFDRLTAGRGRALVPADGLDRRPPVLLLRVADGGLHDQLPRVRRHGDDGPARDRPHVLLRAAAGVRESADAGDDPDGGCREAQARGVSLFHGGRPPLRRRDPRRQAGHSRSPIACSTRSATS